MSGGPSAAGKARQRAANKAAGNVTRSGSSGMSTLLLDMERKAWTDVEDVADHIADIGGLFYSGQITAAGTMTLQVGVPLEYIADAGQVALAAKQGALFFRVYVVTPESMAREGSSLAEAAEDGFGLDTGD